MPLPDQASVCAAGDHAADWRLPGSPLPDQRLVDIRTPGTPRPPPAPPCRRQPPPKSVPAGPPNSSDPAAKLSPPRTSRGLGSERITLSLARKIHFGDFRPTRLCSSLEWAILPLPAMRTTISSRCHQSLGRGRDRRSLRATRARTSRLTAAPFHRKPPGLAGYRRSGMNRICRPHSPLVIVAVTRPSGP
jgi:hypothetical protein